MGYVDKVRPVCARPCNDKGDAPCPAGKECVMNYKSTEPTMGMSQARADEQYMCMPSKKK